MRVDDRPSLEERLTALHTQLVDAVADLVHSDKWAQMLAAASRFPTYSPSNVLLIATQRPDATRVAGIRTWNDLGRHVIKGEHGIAILAPCLYRTSDPAPIHSNDGDRPPPEPDDGPLAQRELRGFRVVHVFDVSQTDGAPLPDVQPRLLEGDAPEPLWNRLVGLVQHDGYRIERRTCPAGVNGWTSPADKSVVVDERLGPAQSVKTLAHELGHIRANHADRFPDYSTDRRCRGAAEVEAESIAYIVTSHLGMDPAPYSIPYVAGWGNDLDALRHSTSSVVTVARGLVDSVIQRPSPALRGASPTASPAAHGCDPEPAALV